MSGLKVSSLYHKGDRVEGSKSQPTVGSLAVNNFLTNYSVSYSQDEARFISSRAVTRVPVTNKSGTYQVIPAGSFWRNEMGPKPIGEGPKRIAYSLSSGSYNAEHYALETVIDDDQRRNNGGRPLDMDMAAARLLTQQDLIHRDNYWAQNFFAGSVWTTTKTGGTSDFTNSVKWSASNSDPVLDIGLFADAVDVLTGFMPNTLILGTLTYRRLINNEEIKDRIKHVQRGVVSQELLAQLLGVEEVIVARGLINTAAEPATATNARIFSDDDAWLGYIERANPTLDSPTAVAMFEWTGGGGGPDQGTAQVMKSGRNDHDGVDYHQIHTWWDMAQVAADLGVWITDAVD